MNIFVLTTGRSGSVTFIKACGHISNYTSAHESRISLVGQNRLEYPENHIEADNRLSWFLGRLDKMYGDGAFYVHLIRDRQKTANSFNNRWDIGDSIIRAYSTSILYFRNNSYDTCLDYWDTVNENIKLFLKDKNKKMIFRLEDHKNDFTKFWERIGARGNLNNALDEWDIKYNIYDPATKNKHMKRSLFAKTVRIISKLPHFIRTA